MKKISISSLIALTILSAGISPLYAEQAAPECMSTWMQGSAKDSCGEHFCTYQNMNPFIEWSGKEVFVSRYDTTKNECTFETFCVTTPDKNPYMKYEEKRTHYNPYAYSPDTYLPTVSTIPEKGMYSDNGEEKVSMCKYTSKTVKKDTRLKNQDGQLEIDGVT